MGGGSAVLFEVSQASPAYPSDKSSVKMKAVQSITEMTEENRSTGKKNRFKCRFILLKTHMDLQGNKPGYPG